jgi:hypothetical protein
MGLVRLVAVVSLLSATSLSAQSPEWIEYVDRADRFHINFPGKPTITQITYEPQRGEKLPGRVYTVKDGPETYTMTVVDYAKASVNDVPHAVAWAAWNYRKRGGEISYDSYAQVDRIAGHQLHIHHADKTQSIIGIYLHARRLYIMEARGPASAPGALHFQQSLMILDEDGKRIRYDIDDNGDRTTRITNLDGIC